MRMNRGRPKRTKDRRRSGIIALFCNEPGVPVCPSLRSQRMDGRLCPLVGANNQSRGKVQWESPLKITDSVQ